MAGVGVVLFAEAEISDVVKHFVLAFTGDDTVGDHDVEVLVEGVLVDLVLDEEVELLAQVEHEVGAGGDCIPIEQVGDGLTLRAQLVFQNLRIFCTSESSGALLVHFGSWRDSIDRHEENFLWLDGVDQFIDGSHDRGPDLLQVSIHATNLLQSVIDAIVHDTI